MSIPEVDETPAETGETAETESVEQTEATEAAEAAESTGDAKSEFAREADAAEMSFAAEFWDFLVHNKAWWLTPIIIVLALVFGLVLLAQTPFAPFIYH